MLRRVGRLLAAASILLMIVAPVAEARVPNGDPPPPNHFLCPAGTYSDDGNYDTGHPEQCLAIPATFASTGCWTLVVPDGMNSVDVTAVGAAGQGSASSSATGGFGDQIDGTVTGLVNNDRLRVCVNSGAGSGGGGSASGEPIIRGGDGGGASGVATGSTFQFAMIVAGGGGGAGDYTYGGDAGYTASNGTSGPTYPSDGGEGGKGATGSAVGNGGAGGSGGHNGANGTQTAAGTDLGHGGTGGAGYTSGGGGGGGFFGGGGGGSGPSNGNFAGGGGGGSSRCGDANGVTVTGCSRTAQVGTSHSAGSNANEAHVSLAFHAVPLDCAPGTYSASGSEPCTAIPAVFTTAGCWTLTVPNGTENVGVDAIGTAGFTHGGLGDEMVGLAAGLSDGDQLRVCVGQGGGTGASGNLSNGGNGGGASGVSTGSDFSHPFVVAGAGGGGTNGNFGGDAGMPNAQPGVNGGGGGSNSTSSGGAGGQALYPGVNKGTDGAGFDANGPGRGGNGGPGDAAGAAGGGAGGGGGYFAGGGGGNGDYFAGGGTGGGGGTSYCGSANVSLTVVNCVRTPQVGTDTTAGSGAGQARVTLTFNVACAVGYYSATGQEPCTAASKGHFVDTVGASAQSDCALGHFQNETAQASCKPADIGYYVDTTAADHETSCPSGLTTLSTGSDSASDCYDPAPNPDTTDPDMGEVGATLRDGGHVGSASIEVSWSASDDTSDPSDLVFQVERRRLKAGGWTAWGNTQSVSGSDMTQPEIPLWRTQQYRVRAKDEAGNWSDWAESNTIYPIRRDERHFKFTGNWQHIALPGAMRGHVERGVNVNTDYPSATFGFTGNGIALVMSGSGAIVNVTVDGDIHQIYPGATLKQFAITFTGLAPGTHTLSILVVAGTADVDGAIITR